ncbi:MAG: HAD family hydrolase [Blastocatellia bacterium]|nr:HAD family hydrolase [Blastocatellia bacterium]
MSFDCFIFDFDGTLAHSERAYREAFDHSIRLHTGLEIEDAEFRDFWNMTPREVLVRYGAEAVERMLVSFEEHYYANHHHHLVAYSGIEEMLNLIIERGALVAIVSLKPRRAGELELDITGLRPLIHSTVWGDDVERPKPEPEGVLQVLRRAGADRERTLVIGDSPSDIMMGRAAGTRTAAALWGGAVRERLMAASPDLAFDAPEDLIDLIRDA